MLGLSFLAPAFLLGAAAVAVPVFLHLFRRQAEPEIKFSAVRFLRHAPVEQARRRKLRELLLLLLRATALLLLALAFARPYFLNAGAAGSAAVTIVAVDTSYSMSAPGQFDRARTLAHQAVDAAPTGHRVGVVSFADGAELVAQPWVSRGAAKAAIDRLHPGYGATRYGVALARAAQTIGANAGRIVVVTDLQQRGWEAGDFGGVPSRVAVDVADTGAPASNLAVVDLRRDSKGPVALVHNSGSEPRNSRARLSLGDRRVSEVPLTVPARLSTEARFPFSLPDAGVASVTIEDEVGYAADNTRYLLIDPPEPADVLTVTATGSISGQIFYLERALLIAGASSRFRMTTVTCDRLATMAPEDLKRYPVVLLLGTRGLERRGREVLISYVAAGGGLFAALGPEVEPDVLEGMLAGVLRVKIAPAQVTSKPVTFAPADTRHPIFRAFGALAGNLSAIRFNRAVRISDHGSGQTIARFSDGAAALVEYQVGRGRVLLFGSDLNNRWNDFPLQPTFVPFVHEVVGYVARARDDQRDFLVGDLPAGLPRKPGPVEFPTGVAAGGSGAAVRPLPGRRVVANVDVRESDPSRLTLEQFAAAINRMQDTAAVEARSEARDEEERQRLWQYGLVLMIVGLVVEGLLGSRMG